MIKMMQRVNKGSRKMYERTRIAENCGKPEAIVCEVVCETMWVLERGMAAPQLGSQEREWP